MLAVVRCCVLWLRIVCCSCSFLVGRCWLFVVCVCLLLVGVGCVVVLYVVDLALVVCGWWFSCGLRCCLLVVVALFVAVVAVACCVLCLGVNCYGCVSFVVARCFVFGVACRLNVCVW